MRIDEETRTKKKHEQVREQEHETETERTEKKNKKRKKDKTKTTVDDSEPEPERIKAKVQFIPDQADKIPPLVGYFPSMYKPNEDERRPRVRVYRNMNERKNRTGRMELMVSSGDLSVEYAGTSHSGEAMAP